MFTQDGEVYLRRFDDCGWRGVSASDRDGGISNSLEAAAYPSFASHAGTTCVSWEERVDQYPRQFVRCHDMVEPNP